MADIAKLGLQVDAAGGIRAMQQFGQQAAQTTEKATLLEGAAGKLGRAFTLLGVGALGAGIFRKTIAETMESQRAMAQLEAVLQSTGGAAGRTAGQLADMASALQKVTTYGDDAIMKAQALLLTFTQIRGGVFDDATKTVLDLATAMGGDLQGAAIQVGKALNDPIRGVSTLQRVGVSFSEAQQQVIKDLVETGRVADAQRLILKELQTEFGGSAAAARDTLGGALDGLKNAWGDLFEVTKGGTQGSVDAINALTRSLEDSGITMNSFITNTMVGWENIVGAAKKLHAILSIDLTKGNFLAEARRLIKEINAETDAAIARITAPAKTGPIASAGATTATGETDAARRAREAAEKASKRAAEEYEDLLRRRENDAIESARRQIESMGEGLATTITGSILGGLRKSLGPLGAMLDNLFSSIAGNFIRQIYVARAGGDIRSVMDLNDIADASKSMTPGKWMGGAGIGLSSAALGYGIGSHARNMATAGVGGALGGAATGAMMGSVIPGIGTAVGAAVGALAGLTGGIFGFGKASAEAARQLAEARRSVTLTLEMMRAERAGDTVAMKVIQEKAKFDQIRKQIEEAYGGKKAQAEREKLLAEVNAEEARRIALIKAEKDAIDGVNRAALNLPAIFKLAGAVFSAIDPLSLTGNGGGLGPAGRWPTAKPAVGGGDTTIIVELDGQKVGTGVVRNLQRRAAREFGDSTRWGEVTIT
jgi:hypothetical protein